MPKCLREFNYPNGSENKEVILIGDFNCDWSLLANNEANAHTNILAEIMNTLQFEQLIKEPTRVTATTKTLIDLAFTNKPELINGSGVTHLGISDHSMIYIQRSISIPRGEPKIVKTRQFKQYNANNFKADIFTYLNDEIFLHSTLDPNVMWGKWKTRFLTAPPITKRVRSQYAPWITNNIRQVMRQRDYLKKKAVKTGSKQFHEDQMRIGELETI